jgi:flagellar basal-body rod protein FlgB
MRELFGKTIHLLKNVLDYQSERHKVIVSNVANLDTPGYKAKELVFEKSLQESMLKGQTPALTRTHAGHMGPEAGKGGNHRIVSTGEAVNIDKAMTSLAENNLMYNMTAEMLLRKFNGLNTVLKDAK